MNLCNAGLTRGMDDISLPPSLPPCLSLSLLYAWRHMYLDVCKCVFASLRICLCLLHVSLCVCLYAYMHTIHIYRQTDILHACVQTDRDMAQTCMHPSIHTRRQTCLHRYFLDGLDTAAPVSRAALLHSSVPIVIDVTQGGFTIKETLLWNHSDYTLDPEAAADILCKHAPVLVSAFLKAHVAAAIRQQAYLRALSPSLSASLCLTVTRTHVHKHIQVEAYPIYAPGKTRPRMTQGPLRLLPALIRLRYHA